jgi:hypothetical protein
MNPRRLAALGLLAIALALLWIALTDRQRPSSPTREGATGVAALYAPRDWSSAQGSSQGKISVFAFRDRNRNGRYDRTDLPMAGVGVRLTRPDGARHMRSSNTNGYTNFSMAIGGEGSDITEVGRPHRFEVLVPPGFLVTTGNAVQEARFRSLTGAPAGMVAENPPAVVGLAPALWISGRVAPPTGPAHASQLTAIAADGERFAVTIDDTGHFRFSAKPGAWRLRLSGADGSTQPIERRVHVFDTPVVVSALRPSRHQPAQSLRTEDFEYLHRAEIDKIPNGYAGLDWDYLLAVDNQLYRGPGYVNVLISGRAVAYNSSGHPATISALPGERFDFAGAHFAVAWPSAEGETLIAEAWRDGVLVGKDQLTLSFLGPVWFDADYQAIDRLTLTTEHYWQFVVDDMRFAVRNR